MRRPCRRWRADTPLLIRIEINSAHGASSLDKQLDSAADIYSFVLFNLGVTPVIPGAQTAPMPR